KHSHFFHSTATAPEEHPCSAWPFGVAHNLAVIVDGSGLARPISRQGSKVDDVSCFCPQHRPLAVRTTGRAGNFVRVVNIPSCAMAAAGYNSQVTHPCLTPPQKRLRARATGSVSDNMPILVDC